MHKNDQRIHACLWFDGQAEEAAAFYKTVFTDSEIGITNRYTEAGKESHQQPIGSVMTVEFRIDNQWFVGLNGGPAFTKTPAISFLVSRETRSEIDRLWAQLSENGKVMMPLEEYPFSEYYGWLEDRFGVSWQLILPKPEGDPRPAIVPSMLFVGEHCGQAEEAMNTYLEIFQPSQKGLVVKYDGTQPPDKEGTIMFADLCLDGQWFAVMDSAWDHKFSFNEGISFIVNCDSQEEIDHYWDRLGRNGDPKARQCGWVKDKFGVSWQIDPRKLPEMIHQSSEASAAVFGALMHMKKIDLEVLENTFSEATHH